MAEKQTYLLQLSHDEIHMLAAALLVGIGMVAANPAVLRDIEIFVKTGVILGKDGVNGLSRKLVEIHQTAVEVEGEGPTEKALEENNTALPTEAFRRH